jgi:hypothetical protein
MPGTAGAFPAFCLLESCAREDEFGGNSALIRCALLLWEWVSILEIA